MVREPVASAEGDGGEQAEENSPVTTSSCTEICGEGLRGKSCSKICLANVHPKGHPELKKKMYVMLDDQSNLSLAGRILFVEHHFYVDDGLKSFSSVDDAIDVLKRTQHMLAQSNL